MKKGKIYLIPNVLGEGDHRMVLPENVKSLVQDLKYYIVENVRTARRFLKKVNPGTVIDNLTFFELNKHTNPTDFHHFLEPAIRGESTGIITEAGVPGVADPGAEIVKIAHEKEIQVIPMVGPSSILLALMASGLNGQNFAFNGYLPIPKKERISRIKFFEKRSKQEDQSQLFIETPYRNNALLEDLIQHCQPDTQLCIAADITLETEYIYTTSVSQWKKKKMDLHKRPCIFIIQA